ncbi:MAG: hypothetical protein QM756_43820 [Polyangiaceae bacterium]
MLSNREFSALVDKGTYPEQVSVPLDTPFTNHNGTIQNLLLERFSSAAVITSVAGSIRANHWHRTDWHYSYVVSGVVEYYHRLLGSGAKPKHERYEAGKMFFTPPNVEHAMFFPEATVFITLAKNIRDTAHHEEDVVRVPLIAATPDPNRANHWVISFPGAE